MPERLPTSAIVAVLVVAVVAAVFITTLATGGVSKWSGGGGPDIALSLPQASTPTTTAIGGTPESAVASGGPLHVHAAGAVVRPGVVEVPAGARVSDVVTAAGGATAEADLDAINLAALVKDAERVYIPRHGEAAPIAIGGDGGAASTATGGSSIVNINQADETQLEALPGVGPATAKAIVDYRTQHGPFAAVDDLLNVRGIGPAKLEQIKPFARV